MTTGKNLQVQRQKLQGKLQEECKIRPRALSHETHRRWVNLVRCLDKSVLYSPREQRSVRSGVCPENVVDANVLCVICVVPHFWFQCQVAFCRMRVAVVFSAPHNTTVLVIDR